MNTKSRLPLVAILSLAVTGAFASSVLAAQDDQESIEDKRTKKIVRVISTSDAPGNIEDFKRQLVVVGEHGFAHRRGYLGVQMVELTPELRRHFGAPADAGVMISSVIEESPAATAGLKVGDIVTALDGQAVASGLEIARKVSAHDDQSVAILEVWRDGAVQTYSATIVERERPAIDIGRIAGPHDGQLHERFWVGPDKAQAHIIEIDEGGLQDALHELELRFENPNFVKKFQVLGKDRIDLQKRIEELEERLKDLEQQLDKLPSE